MKKDESGKRMPQLAPFNRSTAFLFPLSSFWNGVGAPLNINVKLFRLLAMVGGAALGLGLFFAPQRAWLNLLLAGYALTGFGLAGMVFVALQYITGAGWSVVLRRVAEAMSGALWVGGAVVLLVLTLAPSLYEWTRESVHSTSFKGLWLNRPFFLARAVVYLGVWGLLSRSIIKVSRRQDRDADIAHTRRNVRLSALFIVTFALTFCAASFDWVMSLSPEWFSTIFGVYNFAGMFQSGLALMIVFVTHLSRRGPLNRLVTGEHLHDLGKLLFAFSIFWMYIWFSQYMLIWYANIPEEAVYYTRRMTGAWQSLMLLNVFLNWVVPFGALMSVATKRNPAILAKVALAVLAGRWLDLYLMTAPSLGTPQPFGGVWEAGTVLALVGVTALAVERTLRQAPIVPLGDPFLGESLRHHQ